MASEGFMSLPGELRNAVYDHLLFPESDTLSMRACNSNKDIVNSIMRSPIFRVSKEIRIEALSRLLSTKRIDINTKTMVALFRYVGELANENVVDLSVIISNSSDMHLWKVSRGHDFCLAQLSALRNLKRLELRHSFRQGPLVDILDLRLRDLKRDLEARGEVKVKIAERP
ncbi:hypothetical protein K458DRAFT_27780 [Lentithecium fluviatile CBS 122367]|uniref:F-box domain-containing protein n=1 Tax=Lentithecium fluviatile CBS 122367 TaxID=1168545 RepID=A0A6G1J396_9PLEO|nr:hypothetical protein K458DRAFT_27780 [Lentithecium fluviatile CBS 122367]